MALTPPGALIAPEPPKPVRAYSFTDWQVNNPTAPPPGDRLDAEFDRANGAISQTLDWVGTSLSTDGTLRAGIIGESQLVPGLFDDIADDAVEQVQPLVDQAGASATQAFNSATAAQSYSTLAGASATRADQAATDAETAATTAQGAANGAQDSAAAAASSAVDAANSANHADGSEAVAEAYADVGMAWAEHMPDIIPPNILAVQGVTGDHWSSRWWANQAAITLSEMEDLLLKVPPLAVVNYYTYIATAGQVVFSGPDRDGEVLSYTPSPVVTLLVYANGLLRTPVDDYTGTADTVTFARPRAAGDIVQIQVEGVATTAGVYLPLTGGVMTGPITLAADPVLPMQPVTLEYSDSHYLPFTGGTLTGPGNLVVSGNLTTPLITNGVSLLTIQPNVLGPIQVGGPIRHVNPANDTYNITSNNIASHTDPWHVSFLWLGNSGGAASPLTGVSAAHNFLVNDVVSITGAVQAVGITHNIAPNGDTASGSRTGLGVTVVQVGSSQGGTITGTGISSGAVINMWGRSNLGGTSTLFDGGLSGFNTTMQMRSGASFLRGGSGVEVDTSAEAGVSYGAITQHLNVVLATHQSKGFLNENMSYLVAGQAGALADLMYGVRFTDHDSDTPFGTRAKLVYAGIDHQMRLNTVAANLDFGNTTVGAFHMRQPYSAEVPLQATNITSATRLTSDGQPPSSFIYEAHGITRGTGFATHPSITVTGGGGAVINAMLATGNIMGKPGVFSPGTGVPPEATATVTGGGGSGAAVALVMAGNTMNFAINSAVSCEARIVMRSTTGEAICWTCEFGARMGATASTTAIIGSPAWTQVWATAGAAAAIGISAPVADTTLGAINVTVTPTSLTWSGGGRVRMTKSSRV